MFGFCGSNGAGKTTTMRIAMGLVRADAGEVRWRGRPLDQDVRRRIGYMPEERGLYPKMKVGEQVAYFARLHGLGAAAATSAADEWVERLGLGARRGDAVEKLSLGNQQRVQLAAALVSRPEVLILDEPFSGLDPVGVDSLAEALLGPGPRRRARRLLQPPARPRRAALRLRRHPRPRPHGRHRHRRRAAPPGGRPAAARRRPRGRARGWADGLPGVRVVSERAGDTLLELDDGADDQAVLAAALRTGRVTHFAWRQPTLVELFREAVAAPTAEEVAA